MPKAGNANEKRAARRVQCTLQIPYTEALRLVRDAKTDDINWSQAADAVLAGMAGSSLFEGQ